MKRPPDPVKHATDASTRVACTSRHGCAHQTRTSGNTRARYADRSVVHHSTIIFVAASLFSNAFAGKANVPTTVACGINAFVLSTA